MYTYTHKKRKGREKNRPEKSIQISKLIGYILYWGASVRAEAGLGRFPRGLFISRARRAVVEIQSQPLRPAKLPTSSGYIECGYRMQPRDPTVHRLMSWTRPIPAEESWEWALGQKVSGRRGPEVGLTARWPQRPTRRLFFAACVWIITGSMDKERPPYSSAPVMHAAFLVHVLSFFSIFCLLFFVHSDIPAHVPQSVHSAALTTGACGRSQSLHVVAIRCLLLFPLLIDYIFLSCIAPSFLPSCVTNKQGEGRDIIYTHMHAHTHTKTLTDIHARSRMNPHIQKQIFFLFLKTTFYYLPLKQKE